jgi:hypothetical protein
LADAQSWLEPKVPALLQLGSGALVLMPDSPTAGGINKYQMAPMRIGHPRQMVFQARREAIRW